MQATQLPAIDVSSARELSTIPWVETDDRKIAELAVQHFLERGFRHLAFCGDGSFNWSRWRREAFVAESKKVGIDARVFDMEDD